MSGRSDDYIADLTRWIREISACAVSDPPYSYVHHHWISRRLLGDEDGWSIECAQCGRPYPSPFRSPGHGDRDYRELMMILRIANTVESWLPRASEADEETANQANQADRDKSDTMSKITPQPRQPHDDVAPGGFLTDELTAWLADGGDPETGSTAYLTCLAKEVRAHRAYRATLTHHHVMMTALSAGQDAINHGTREALIGEIIGEIARRVADALCGQATPSISNSTSTSAPIVEGGDTCGETCTCGRRKYTREDLNRWNTEISAARDTRFNPDWAKKTCWADPKYHCNMEPLSKEAK